VLVASLTAVAGLAAIGAVMFRGAARGSGAIEAAAPAATASLDLRSQPAGASIFVDGAPTGLKTPAVLSGLPTGRTVTLRLDLAGYVGASKQTTLTAEPQRLSFTLDPALGTVQVRGVPPRAKILLDDRPIEAAGPFSASFGTHKLRVELADSVLLSKTIEVRPGQETELEITADRSDP
jgi:hypothetical protein